MPTAAALQVDLVVHRLTVADVDAFAAVVPTRLPGTLREYLSPAPKSTCSPRFSGINHALVNSNRS